MASQNSSNLIIFPEPQAPRRQPPASFHGLLADLKRSTNFSKTFSLRRKADPRRDAENLIPDVINPEKAKAIRLISLDF